MRDKAKALAGNIATGRDSGADDAGYGEITDWRGNAPEWLQAILNHLARLKAADVGD
jgi:hypothetical protein